MCCRCETCKYWTRHENNAGECNAPIPVWVDTSDPITGGTPWLTPAYQDASSCGMYNPSAYKLGLVDKDVI